MESFANCLKRSLRTIQIIMIGSSLLGIAAASDSGEELEDVRSSSDYIFKMDKTEIGKENLSHEKKDKNDSNGSDESAEENDGGTKKGVTTDDHLLKLFNIDKELSQPNIIQNLRSLREENEKLMTLLKEAEGARADYETELNLLKETQDKMKTNLVDMTNARDDLKAQLLTAQNRITGLVKRDSSRTLKRNIIWTVGSVFTVLYFFNWLITNSAPPSSTKFEL